jgi:hypothetical protein
MIRGWNRELRDRVRRICAFDLATAALMALVLVLALDTFTQYAVSNDEGVQHHYGELIIAYYKSGFIDKSVFGYKNLYLYGGLFDIIAVLLAHLLPFDPYDIRHLLSALAGIGGVAATWATARAIAGPRAGFMAALALAMCGVWYGGMFNHTKDIPFAAAMMGATYYLVRSARDLPDPRRRDMLLFGLLLGAALGLRVTGLVIVAYLGLTIAVAAWLAADSGGAAARAGIRSLARFAPALALAYLIMIVSWPWASLSLFNPVRAILDFAEFNYPVRTMMNGAIYQMSDVPRWYEPEYLAIKLPLILLIAATAATLRAAWSSLRTATRTANDVQLLETALLIFTIAFPLACQVVGHGPSFSGMRHFMFVVPPLAALAGVGIDAALAYLEPYGRTVSVTALAAVMLAFGVDAASMVRLHPYEYLFYNSIVGGLPGASRRYDTDYWVNIMPAAVKDLEAYLDKTGRRIDPLRPQQFTVGVCGERVSFENEADRRLRWTPDWDHADFFIAPTHMNCDEVLRGKVVDVIERVGVPIGVVKDLRGLSPQARWTPVEVAHAPTKSASAATPHG